MQGDSLVSNRSLTVAPTVPPAKNSSAQAQAEHADMLVTGRRLRNEEHGLHGHTALWRMRLSLSAMTKMSIIFATRHLSQQLRASHGVSGG